MNQYTRPELEEAADGRWPNKGQRCEHCRTWIPEFAELTDSDRDKILKLIASGRHEQAQQELTQCTGAPPRFAKIWVLHSGKPQPKYQGPPCPHCGTALPSPNARQCLNCKADWH